MSNLQIGDVLSRPKGLLIHKSVYLGGGKVFHNTPKKGEHISDINDFSKGRPITVEKTQLSGSHLALRRVAISLKAKRKYYATSNNCEHSVTRVIHGKAESSQLKIFGLLATASILWFVIKSK